MAKKLQIPSETRRNQLIASNPANSAWVSANAGSGKTYVLAQRVIRLMLEGIEPAKILCLTFTKAAAAQMQNRVFSQLADWVMMEENQLADMIENLSGNRPSAKGLDRARQLFSIALDTPGGLKIQTIHAFCESLLHQFPLEANIPAHFQVMDDLSQKAMIRQARNGVLASKEAQLQSDIGFILSRVSEDAFNKALDAVVDLRQELLPWFNRTGEEGAREALAAALGVDPEESEADICDRLASEYVLEDAQLREVAIQATAEGKATDKALASRIVSYLEARKAQHSFDLLRKRNSIFLKKDGDRLKNVLTKGFAATMPEMSAALDHEADLAVEHAEIIRRYDGLWLSMALFRLGDDLLTQYSRLKSRREMVDFDDLLEATAGLLTRSDIGAWIQYKLDQRIEHVLVDEAQDTSPQQWEIINAVTDEFFSGDGAQDDIRTMFVVGDEKQSIYSFQGARPEEFAAQRLELGRRINALEDSRYRFHPLNLTLSFRSTRDVVHGVDRVFENPQNYRGLQGPDETGSSAVGTVHESVRQDEPGEIRIWSPFKDARNTDKTDWIAPVDREEEAGDPAVLLARKIAETISQRIGTTLEGKGRPITYGDVLILVRKRDRFATAMTRELKKAGLKVAGSDRMKLTQHVAVEDLIALGRFVLMPEDDLSVAAILKSPLFGLDDDDLMHLAIDRGPLTLFSQLGSQEDSRYQIVYQTLVHYRQIARSASVHDFFAHVLSADGGRRKLLARLGPEVEDVLDAFMGTALDYTHSGGMSLDGFLHELTQSEPDIKREFDEQGDEIRILTVHASKGLEAPIVFLVDPCTKPFQSAHQPKILPLHKAESASGSSKAYVWRPAKDHDTTPTTEALAQIETLAEEEYNRLLYVGMTRAADRLVVCGYMNKNDSKAEVIKHRYWLAMVTDALQSEAEIVQDDPETGFREMCWKSPRSRHIPASPKPQDDLPKTHDHAFPLWALNPAPREPVPPRPLSPSGAHAMIMEEAARAPSRQRSYVKGGEGVSLEADDRLRAALAMKRGTAIHKLLQVLPDKPPETRRASAETYLARILHEFSEDDRQACIDQVFSILDHSDWQAFFSTESAAEVPVCGRMDIIEEGRPRPRMVAGQIDRLHVGAERTTIIDYKTDRIPPTDATGIAPGYLMQLALYRELVGRIYPGKPVSARILWTQTPLLMEIPDSLMDEALNQQRVH